MENQLKIRSEHIYVLNTAWDSVFTPQETPLGPQNASRKALGSLLSTLETSQEPLRSLLTLSKSVKGRQRGNLEREERFLTRNGARKPDLAGERKAPEVKTLSVITWK